MMSLRTGPHQSAPPPQGLPNSIMHPTRIMGLGFSREWLREGDDEREPNSLKAKAALDYPARSAQGRLGA